jgi:hypothetical protein
MDDNGAQCGEIPGLAEIILKMAIAISWKFAFSVGSLPA